MRNDPNCISFPLINDRIDLRLFSNSLIFYCKPQKLNKQHEIEWWNNVNTWCDVLIWKIKWNSFTFSNRNLHLRWNQSVVNYLVVWQSPPRSDDSTFKLIDCVDFATFDIRILSLPTSGATNPELAKIRCSTRSGEFLMIHQHQTSFVCAEKQVSRLWKSVFN